MSVCEGVNGVCVYVSEWYVVCVLSVCMSTIQRNLCSKALKIKDKIRSTKKALLPY